MTSSPRPSSVGSKEELRLLWKMAGLAFQFGTEIIAGVLLGYGVDWYFNTAPWGVVIGALAGIAVGTLDLVRRAIKINSQLPEPKRPPGGWNTPSGKAAAGRKSALPEDVLDPEFEEALDHDQWKTIRDRPPTPPSTPSDEGRSDQSPDEPRP